MWFEHVSILALVAIWFGGAEPLGNFVRGMCEIILNLNH